MQCGLTKKAITNYTLEVFVTPYLPIISLIAAIILISFGTYGLRGFFMVLKFEELGNVKRLWLPVISSGFFFYTWSVLNMISHVETIPWYVHDVITPTILLGGCASVAVGVRRFTQITIEYAKRRQEAKHATNT